MPSRDPRREARALAGLLVLAASCSLASAYALLRRSTIPLALEAEVVSRELAVEKHPGRDDAHFLLLEDALGERRRLRVDRAAHERVADGSWLSKPAWSRRLEVDGQDVTLEPADAARGMLGVALLSSAGLVLAAALTPRAFR